MQGMSRAESRAYGQAGLKALRRAMWAVCCCTSICIRAWLCYSCNDSVVLCSLEQENPQFLNWGVWSNWADFPALAGLLSEANPGGVGAALCDRSAGCWGRRSSAAQLAAACWALRALLLLAACCSVVLGFLRVSSSIIQQSCNFHGERHCAGPPGASASSRAKAEVP